MSQLTSKTRPATPRPIGESGHPCDTLTESLSSDWLNDVPAEALTRITASLDDAITVLEGTRHAFKSAQLAQLRKRLSALREELSRRGNCGKTDIQ